MKIKLSYLLMLMMFTTSISAQSILGKWKTIDDDSGQEKSIVNIFEKDGKVYGTIVALLNREPGDENPICEKCTGDRKNKHVVGLEIIREMEKDGDKYEDGTIMDPDNGKSYNCKLWIENDNPNILKVRGYISVFYRTQTWHRVK